MLSTPLHPILVHFPIALLTLGVITQFLALWKKEFFTKAALLLVATGFFTGILSYASGDGAEHFAKSQWGQGVRPLIHTHETFALITLVLFGFVLALQLINLLFRKSSFILITALLVFSFAGLTTLTITGHYGGKIVYQHSNNEQQLNSTSNND